VLCATKKNNILTLVLFEKKILNETKNHNPPLQVKWSVPYAREGLSAILFSLYVNEFEMEFLCNGNVPYEVQELSLFVLMYADDMILFSESTKGL
jgi:hypothetical protein